MSIAGGIAGKMGDTYEAKWIARHLLDVIEGKAEWIKYEGVSPEDAGFEFSVSRNGIIEWHQNKRTISNGNWTIKKLSDEGIFENFKRNLIADKTCKSVFVSQDSASQLREITSDSRIANSYDEFKKEIANKEQKQIIDELEKVWNINGEEAWKMLKRIEVITIPECEVVNYIEAVGQYIFETPQSGYFPELREYLNSNFNKKITAEVVKAEINNTNLVLNRVNNIPVLGELIKRRNKEYLDSYGNCAINGEIIKREHANLIYDIISSYGDIKVVALTGVAGHGKSFVLRQFHDLLITNEVPYLCLRIDRYLNCSAVEELGEKLFDIRKNPIAVLKKYCGSKTGVLIIDQVDAVSEVSGRHSAVRDMLMQLIETIKYHNNIKIVISCRTYDFFNDQRLASLIEYEECQNIEVKNLIWDEEVVPLLKKLDVDVSNISEKQKALLRIPVILSVFCQLSPVPEFSNNCELYNRFIEQKTRMISVKQGTLIDIESICIKLSEEITKAQSLSISKYKTSCSSSDLDIIESEGLIVRTNNEIAFFHESFFDFVYAKGFIRKSVPLLQYLLSEEQTLYKKTEARQILTLLRVADFKAYTQNLTAIFNSDQIRYHLKDTISRWISTVSIPTQEEFEIIKELNEQGYSTLFSKAMNSPNWFSLLKDNLWFENELNCKECEDKIISWLCYFASQGKLEEVTCLLSNLYNKSVEHAKLIFKWALYLNNLTPSKSFITFLISTIKQHPAEFIEILECSNYSYCIESWAKNAPEVTVEIIPPVLDAWINLNPDKNPFGHSDQELFTREFYNELSESIPSCFIQRVTKYYLHAIDFEVANKNDWKSRADFKHLGEGSYNSHSECFFKSYKNAIISSAKSDIVTTKDILCLIDPHKHVSCMHLHLEVIRANSTVFKDNFFSLMKLPQIYKAGLDGTPWESFAGCVKQLLKHVSKTEKEIIETEILNYIPKIQNPKGQYNIALKFGSVDKLNFMKRSMFQQWCILETIGFELLSNNAQKRLTQLRRKRELQCWKIPTPKNYNSIAYPISSPIPYDKCKFLKDEHWLTAIESAPAESFMKSNSPEFTGGASELASALGNETKDNPNRFVRLGLNISYDASFYYLFHILLALSEVKCSDLVSLKELIKYAHNDPQKRYGEYIARVIKKHAEIGKDKEIKEIIEFYLFKQSFIEKEHGCMPTLDDKFNFTFPHKVVDKVFESGFLSSEGQFWDALLHIMDCNRESEKYVLDLLECALKTCNNITIKCVMVRILTYTSPEHRNRAISLLFNLLNFNANNEVHSESFYPIMTLYGSYFLQSLFRTHPKQADEITSRMIKHENSNVKYAGIWQESLEALRNGEAFVENTKYMIPEDNYWQLLYSVINSAPEYISNRDYISSLIQVGFSSKNKEIRKASRDFIRHLKKDEVKHYRDLITSYLNSPSFPEESGMVLKQIIDARVNTYETLKLASEQVINSNKKGYLATKGIVYLHLNELLKLEYDDSELDHTKRKEILDIIDKMLMIDFPHINDFAESYDLSFV